MIKSDKSKIKEELLDKKRFLELRVKSLEKQESSLNEQIEKIRKNFSDDKNNINRIE
jgi:chaperonin cofactor prefoldin